MAYTKTNWVNDDTELNAENMNHIEDGIYNSQNVEIIAISDTAPTSCVTGDKYYNTEDNLIYTATGTDTWSEDGEEPIRDVFYILFSEQSSYSYDGTTLVSVGGGTEDIVISDEEPTEEGVKIWIDTGEISQPASEITNSYSTSTGIGYSANYMNTYIDDTGWIDMSSYINTTNFSARSGQPPMARRIGKVVYWKGSVYCSTAVNNREATILSGIPSQFRPAGEFGRCGVTWYISTPYHIFVDDTGAVRVSESSNIEVQNDWAGFTLANISGYLVD